MMTKFILFPAGQAMSVLFPWSRIVACTAVTQQHHREISLRNLPSMLLVRQTTTTQAEFYLDAAKSTFHAFHAN